ncbi:MAG: ATP-dependent Clp protease ATP-binding subunit [Candidatus Moraniibacteriota bacterium]
MFPSSANKFSHRAKQLLEASARIASDKKAPTVEPLHLLLALLRAEGALGYLLLRNLGIRLPNINPEETPATPRTEEIDATPIHTIKNETPQHTTDTLSPALPGNLPFSSEIKQIIVRAFAIAHHAHSPYVGTEHIAHALLELPQPTLYKLFAQAKIDFDTSTNITVRAQQFTPNMPQLEKLFSLTEGGPHENHDDDSATPALDQFGIDFMELPESDASIQKIQFREREIERIIHILGRHRKNNPLLIGEPGVGKTTLVHALAQKILDGSAGALLADKRIIGIDLASIVAGTNFRGEFESRLKDIIRETSENPDIILFIDEIHTIVGAGSASGSLDAANILKPALSRGEIQCIGATSLVEYKRSIEKDAALERRFQSVFVAEPTPTEALNILKESRKQYEQFHHLTLPTETLETAVELSVRHIPDRFLPDKALDLIDEAASMLGHRHQPTEILKMIRETEISLDECFDIKEKAINTGQYESAERVKTQSDRLEKILKDLHKQSEHYFHSRKLTVRPEHIAQVVARMTRIPISKLLRTSSEHIAHLEETLAANIVGQPEVVTEVSHALIRAWSGVSSPDRPLGSFLFLGPSGVGKTLTAKMLASALFENEDALIRLDMSEFMERHTVAQMIGAPPGYVGYGEGGKLTEKVRRQPYSIVLFDEIEKAHPDIFNLLLQILDEGYLTDAEGRKVSFRNTVIILTSNIGTQAFNQSARIGFRSSDTVAEHNFETVKAQVLAELKNRLRPELLGRLDHTLVFKPLQSEHFHRIVEHELNTLKHRLAPQKITLRIPSEIITFLAEVGVQPESGARLIRHKIQSLIETPLAKALLIHPDRPVVIVFTLRDKVIACEPVKVKKAAPRKKPIKKVAKKK